MSREQVLERRLRALHTLEEAVGALRSLSAEHFRTARARLPGARAYRSEIGGLLGVLAPGPPAEARRHPPEVGIVLVAADLGLVGNYTPSLVREALALRAEQGPGPLVCLGRRALAPLRRASVEPDLVRPGPGSVDGLPSLLLPLVDDLLALRQAGRLDALWLVVARFEGAGRFRPERVRLLPVQPPPGPAPVQPSPYTDPHNLQRVVVREHLYAVLYESLLEALSSEHGKRLVTAESARSWLEERTERVRRRLASVRRESSTQEVLETVGAARAVRRQRSGEADPWALC